MPLLSKGNQDTNILLLCSLRQSWTMRLFWFLLLSLSAQWSESSTIEETEIHLLQDAIAALRKGLQFMEDEISDINLDGAFGCRLVKELLDSIVEFNPEILDGLGLRNNMKILAAKARRIAEASKHYLKFTEPQYYADLGRLLEKSETPMWYPSRATKRALEVKPMRCLESAFNETESDQCLIGVLGKRPDKSDMCNITRKCLDMMTKPRQRGYMITHQVLYFQLAEMNNCMKKSKILTNIPRLLQDTLCTNIMRDTIEIADSGYPLNHQDLFMEQIGLCGMWGYHDFYKKEWLGQILQWQKESGCYADRAHWICTDNLREYKRMKREEKILENGCLSHKTTVALLALAASIRFNMEHVSDTLFKGTRMANYE